MCLGTLFFGTGEGSDLPTALRDRNQRVPGIPTRGATGAGMLSVVDVTIKPMAMASAAATTICRAEPGSFRLSSRNRCHFRLWCTSPTGSRSSEDVVVCCWIRSSVTFLDSIMSTAPLSTGRLSAGTGVVDFSMAWLLVLGLLLRGRRKKDLKRSKRSFGPGYRKKSKGDATVGLGKTLCSIYFGPYQRVSMSDPM